MSYWSDFFSIQLKISPKGAKYYTEHYLSNHLLRIVIEHIFWEII